MTDAISVSVSEYGPAQFTCAPPANDIEITSASETTTLTFTKDHLLEVMDLDEYNQQEIGDQYTIVPPSLSLTAADIGEGKTVKFTVTNRWGQESSCTRYYQVKGKLSFLFCLLHLFLPLWHKP